MTFKITIKPCNASVDINDLYKIDFDVTTQIVKLGTSFIVSLMIELSKKLLRHRLLLTCVSSDYAK